MLDPIYQNPETGELNEISCPVFYNVKVNGEYLLHIRDIPASGKLEYALTPQKKHALKILCGGVSVGAFSLNRVIKSFKEIGITNLEITRINRKEN